MKKVMIALAFAGLFSGASAQTNEVPTEKYSVATNSFWSNWFLQVSGVGTNFVDAGTKNSDQFMKSDNISYGAAVAVGKWFTPGLGLRVKLNAWEAKYEGESFKYGVLRGDALFNLSNLFCGYSDTRVWNLTPFLGAGFARDCSTNNYEPALAVGVNSSWRLGKHVNLFLEGSLTGSPKIFAGNETGGEKQLAHCCDKLYNVEIGLNFNLGKTGWSKTPDVDALMAMNKSQIDALQNSLSDAEAENARLKDMLAKAQKVETRVEVKKELASTGVSVFFNLNSSKVASKKDLVNVQALADYAKANNSKITVVGFADSKTGTSAYNKQLSEKRAQVVADALVKMGVNRDNIEVVGNGGTDTLAPMSYNRRAVVTLK